nr:transposase [uncultured Blautia sp.]
MQNYEKFVEIFTVQTAAVYGLDTSNSYFDCTNFYFEIDREDDFRKKGPSKENKKEPIIGLGLLLDRNQIPVGMKMYPGNVSEKPILRDVIDGLKNRNNITGKTIHVADKGLNCAQNIAFSKQNGDGYLFSKSVKTLPSTEKTWVLSEQDYKDVKDKRNDFGEAGKYVDFTDKTGNKAKTRMNRAAIDKDLALAGYNLLVTSETQMTDQDIYCTYHNLWRIEESFKIMKSDLDARPVFLQKENTIKGHFLICYLTVLLERIFQFKILDEKYSISDIFRFIKDFRVTKGEHKYINTIFDYKL